ncbi:PEPxxWA-CTERM sorting domain-containing protein [Sphingomonas sp.]|jgi:hypothetical protein|uniref:PEPxxWA-CTERM sorting domain-containing protein n=1 Tax=Sphingomonas sp. TaxID=28214 RepID=UPI002DF28050|nr:PEPxxWA-CTERM sorting domain-containing protein [Sphingomonas sp.]
MKYLFAAAAAVLAAATPATAAILTLQSVQTNGPSNYTFRYQATLNANEGLRNGDRFVIFDFDGYISPSVGSSSPLLVASTELVSAAPLTPGFTDDPTKTNLVFTYFGSGFRTTGGPTLAFDIEGLSARSVFGGVSSDGFYARTTKNDPTTGADTALFTLGSVTIPAPGNNPNAVPEPATWAMMIGGLGLIGASMRRRRSAGRIVYA